MNRFSKNFSTISTENQAILKNSNVLVVGLGGLGGIVSEGLVRAGLYNIGICDFDKFDVSNLNRQLLSNEHNIGKSKLDVCYTNLININSEINIIKYDKFTIENEKLINDISSYDIVIDCLDNYETRKLLHTICSENDIKVVYGAIAGHFGYFGVSTKNNFLIFDNSDGIEKELGNPFYTPAIIGSMQIKLALDVLFNNEYFKDGFYYLDLNSFAIEKISLL